MLTKKIGLMAVALTLGFSSVASASHAPKDKWYVGADVQWAHLANDNDVKNIRLNGASFDPQENKAGVSIFAGYRWDFLGAELGVTGYNQKKTSGTYTAGTVTAANGQVKQQNYNVYLDGIYYHCLAHNFDLKALVGVGFLNTKFKGTNVQINDNGTIANTSGNQSHMRAGLRLGIGGEYYFTDCVSSSLMYKFQTGNSYVKNVQTVALGVAYHF